MINNYLLFSIIARLITLVLLGYFIIPRQIHEVMRVKDQFTRLRKYVLAWILFFVAASIPVLIYQYTTIHDMGRSDFQNIATLASGAGNLAVGIVLYLIYNYKYEVEDE